MMTTEHDFGKDHVVFLSQQEVEIEPKYQLPPTNPDDEPAGAIMPNGEINWDCPCLGGMASGPCALQFQDAFSCFHFSKEDPKGRECVDQFQEMQLCLSKYPGLYPMASEKDDALDTMTAVEEEAMESSTHGGTLSENEEDKFIAAAAASQQKQQAAH